MTRYKLWLQVEAINDSPETYENIGEPICLGTYAIERNAQRQKFLVAYVLGDQNSLSRDEVIHLAAEIRDSVG